MRNGKCECKHHASLRGASAGPSKRATKQSHAYSISAVHNMACVRLLHRPTHKTIPLFAMTHGRVFCIFVGVILQTHGYAMFLPNAAYSRQMGRDWDNTQQNAKINHLCIANTAPVTTPPMPQEQEIVPTKASRVLGF